MDAVETGKRDCIVFIFIGYRIAPGNDGRLLFELEQLEAMLRSYDEMNPVAPPNIRVVVVVVVFFFVFPFPARLKLELGRSRHRRYYL